MSPSILSGSLPAPAVLQKRMKEPVVAADGHTYERAAIEKWLMVSDLSPVTKFPLPHKALTPNFILASLMDGM